MSSPALVARLCVALLCLSPLQMAFAAPTPGETDLIRERSGGRINVKVYPGSQLVGGDQTRELVAMRQGVIDMTVSSTINLSPQIREMNLFSLPFLMPGPAAFDALMDRRADPDIIVASAKAYLSALNKLSSKADRVAAQG